jgi:hypothetical protein
MENRIENRFDKDSTKIRQRFDKDSTKIRQRFDKEKDRKKWKKEEKNETKNQRICSCNESTVHSDPVILPGSEQVHNKRTTGTGQPVPSH